MPSKEELRERLHAAKQAKNSADDAIKALVDLKVPEQARADKKKLLTRLRRLSRRMAKRIPILRRRIEAKRKSGAQKAVRAARKHVGVTESPAGSNKGPYPISASQIHCIGYDGVAWCGCEVCELAVIIGGADIPLKARLAYTPYIDQDAGNGANGLTEVSVFHALPGDIAVFNFGSGYAKHTGLVVGPTENGYVHCIEGNTSSGTSGSQDNGGGVYERKRPVSDVICIARPDYQG